MKSSQSCQDWQAAVVERTPVQQPNDYWLWMNLFGSFLGPVKCPNPVLFPAAIFWCISTIFNAFGRELQNAFIPFGWRFFDTTSLLPCFEAYQSKSDPWLKKANRQIGFARGIQWNSITSQSPFGFFFISLTQLDSLTFDIWRCLAWWPLCWCFLQSCVQRAWRWCQKAWRAVQTTIGRFCAMRRGCFNDWGMLQPVEACWSQSVILMHLKWFQCALGCLFLQGAHSRPFRELLQTPHRTVLLVLAAWRQNIHERETPKLLQLLSKTTCRPLWC